MSIAVGIYRQIPIIALGYYVPSDKHVEGTYSHLVFKFKFKQGEDAIKHFVGLTREIFMINEMDEEPFFVATIPSSTTGKSHKSFPEYFKKLAQSFPIRNSTSNLLYRTESKQPAHLGGSRSKAIQTATLSTRYTNKIKGQPVILFDDITTTGNSLKAGVDLLLNDKAIVKLAIVMGQTKRES